MPPNKHLTPLLFIFSILFSAILCQTALATTFNVSTTQELRQALLDAAQNGQEDTIILADGTYKTTDDGGGTFTFLDNEDYGLTLQGSSPENVVLSGDNQHQIFNHNSILDAPMKLEKLSFVDGNNTNGTGGAVNTDYSIEVIDCKFINNSTQVRGGAFYAWGGIVVVKNSTFTGNHAEGGGGAIYTLQADIINSVFENNDSANGGAVRVGSSYADISKIIDSEFTGNISLGIGGAVEISNGYIENSKFYNNLSYSDGGAIQTSGFAEINNSIFKGNISHTNGGAIYAKFAYTTIIYNNIIEDNNASMNGGAIYYNGSGYGEEILKSFLYNNLIKNNVIYYGYMGENNNIYNNIFLNSDSIDLQSNNEGNIFLIYNNLMDISKLTVTSFKSNNIFDGVILGFVDEPNGNYRLTGTSDLIDAGTIDVEGVTFPETDMDGNLRVVGTSIDIGPYEVSTTRPTISSFTVSGDLLTGQELTFTTTAVPADGRTITLYEIDFGDGNFVSASSAVNYTYFIADTYAVTVKVTDSAGEFSTKTINITITPDQTFADLISDAIARGDSGAVNAAILEVLASGLPQEQQAQKISEAIIIAITNERLKWDSNDDRRIGLEEAIRALQVTSGIKP